MAVCLPAAALQVIALDPRGPGRQPTDLYLDEPVAKAHLPGADDAAYPLDGGPTGARSFAGGVRSIDFAGNGDQAGTESIRVGVVARGAASQSTEPVSAIPEPGTYALILAGLVAMGFIWRRRRG